MLGEFATDFEPPPVGVNGATGLYCGEQDLFCFLIDPSGWAEIAGEAFAPGFFVWNSEVGRRTLGVKTFWFQAVCQNHIVWDAVEVVEFSRKHTANVHDGLRDIREIIARLVECRDQRRDSFVRVVEKAAAERLGSDADKVLEVLKDHGIRRTLAKEAYMREFEHVEASTVRRRLAALSSLFKHLIKHGAADRNPVRDVERPPINRREGSTPAFSKAQARRLLDMPSAGTGKGLHPPSPPKRPAVCKTVECAT